MFLFALFCRFDCQLRHVAAVGALSHVHRHFAYCRMCKAKFCCSLFLAVAIRQQAKQVTLPAVSVAP